MLRGQRVEKGRDVVEQSADLEGVAAPVLLEGVALLEDVVGERTDRRS
ncbi:hypothetical protein [Rhodococcoides kroppenstedtii]|nr:hypothetical protein [Rhodococcus kroppenstedtii]